MERGFCPFPYSQPLVLDYLRGEERLKPFYGGWPDWGELKKRAERLAGRKTSGVVVAALGEYNRRLGAGTATMAAIDRLAQGAPVVITGQQAGVCTGPLYTVYKALTAVLLAEKLSGELGRPVVPLFWVAAEDHDFGEINHIDVAGSDGRMVRLRLEMEPGGKYPAASLPCGKEVEALIERLAEVTPPTEFKEGVISLLQETAAAAANLADWFAGIMVRLFAFAGLVVVNPWLPELKEVARNLFARMLRDPQRIEKAFAETSAELLALGYPLQVQKKPGVSHFFVYREGQRLALLRDGERYFLPEDDFVLGLEEAAALAEENPCLFSLDVVLRPVWQDYLFPVIAYVAGPGEISYYAQLRRVYHLFDQEMPVIYPRLSATLIEPSIAKVLRKFAIGEGELFSGWEERKEKHLREADRIGIDSLFAGLRQKIETAYGEVVDRIAGLSPHLPALARENLRRVLDQVDYLEGKVRQEQRQREEVGVRQLEKAALNLWPRRTPQERVFNIFPYLIKYGPDLLTRMAPLVEVERREHHLFYLP